MKYIVETKGLSKSYGDKQVVRDVDLKVPKGCVYGFMGPNGAGKSTTLKMLLGLVKAGSGEARIAGKEMNPKNRLEILKETGSLIESPSYYGHLTGRENLEIVRTLKGAPEKEIDQVLKLVRMERQQNKKAREYSLGMKQRLGLAAALIGRPELLILDEPTNGLDPAGIQEIRELICELPKRMGITVLVSSHLLSEMDQMADYVGIINILTDAGAEVDALRDFMRQLMESTITKEEKLQYLRRQRQKLLADIHSKQKSLDQLDYIIFDTNKATGSAV